MRPARLALLQLVLGAWLAISAATIAGAVLSFRTAPSATEASGDRPEALGARVQAMRYNGAMFRASMRSQVVLAAMAILLAGWLPVPSRGALACVAGASALALILTFVTVPRTTQLARERIESLESGTPVPADRDLRFTRLHRHFALIDLAKSVLLLGASYGALRAVERKQA